MPSSLSISFFINTEKLSEIKKRALILDIKNVDVHVGFTNMPLEKLEELIGSSFQPIKKFIVAFPPLGTLQLLWPNQAMAEFQWILYAEQF